MAKKIDKALAIGDHAIRKYDPSHVFACFSGGHDSLVASHVASRHPRFSGCFHANTGIGIEQSREFVRRTCAESGWRLVEYAPSDLDGGYTYDELVLEMGFPRGPQSHNRCLFYLKQRAMNRLVREHKENYHDRIGLVTGIRRQESNRRMNADMSQPCTRDGAKVWINPIIDWSGTDCTRYIERVGLDRNPVVDNLHRSGECLCGALANPKEIRLIEALYPEAAERIHDLERRCEEKGLVDCRWARSEAPGQTWDDLKVEEMEMSDQLCMDCRWET